MVTTYGGQWRTDGQTDGAYAYVALCHTGAEQKRSICDTSTWLHYHKKNAKNVSQSHIKPINLQKFSENHECASSPDETDVLQADTWCLMWKHCVRCLLAPAEMSSTLLEPICQERPLSGYPMTTALTADERSGAICMDFHSQTSCCDLEIKN